ncbi:hypothetical protein PF005_g3889 [Phytophthora fragariae]|uniref:Hexosyltransferase n=1 Tax=Phytophthora fragariae TaxID=53985 RepID=A0A6A3Z552_9STRA|nr:hypothetical protein PF009_g4267 [Phytophthora fragariae]KAE9152477.1 hypothetical protein PF006_g3315 [Phytophthora fragariae]KAE9229381.1 hypothetical protein PF005_g3889 [Phytophthora fragariae]KAE9324241.1 hypothetical protein PF001_g3519 [Phytophthora fragariae]
MKFVVVALLLLHINAAAFPTDQLAGGRSQVSLDADNQAQQLQVESVDSEPVRGISLVYPTDGAVEMSPVVFKVQIHVQPGREKLFNAQYANASFCVEVNAVTIFCSKLSERALEFHYIGHCTARVYLKRPGIDEDEVKSVSDPVSFTLMSKAELIAHVSRKIDKDHEKHRIGYEMSLVDWAKLQQRRPDRDVLQRLERDGPRIGDRTLRVNETTDVLLVVGVRTAVVSHFPFRQAIRETWANQTLMPQGVKVVFLGCRPTVGSPSLEEAELRTTWEAIELEKQVYGDLLTDELDCDDAYLHLADKTKEFLHFAATQYSKAQYVMVADDDIYLRLDKIVEWLKQLGPQERFYAGHVREIENARKTPPTRIPESPHYLTKEQYPLSELPPFALGANFFLSMDNVQFVSKNRRRLQDLGGMDDISVALWMLTRQVHPTHRIGLQHLRSGPCKNDLITLSDLSASAIRIVHTNVLTQRDFCHGFDRYVWMGRNAGEPTRGSSWPLVFPREDLQLDISFSKLESAREFHFTTTISSPTHAGIKVLSVLAKKSWQKSA